MAKGMKSLYNKSDNLRKHYDIYKKYSKYNFFPSDHFEQREIVGKFLSVLYAKNGIVSVNEASDYKIEEVARKLCKKSKQMIQGTVLESISNLDFSQDTGDLVERISILLGECQDQDIVDIINNELKKYGHNSQISAIMDSNFP